MLFLHFPEALQTLPALRDIRDGPVELLGQRLVRVLGPAVPLQAAKLLIILLCPGTRYFRGSPWVAGIGVSMSRRFRKGFRRGEQASARRSRSRGWSARCWVRRSGEFVGSEDVARHLFRLVLRRSVPFLSMMERGMLAFLMPG